MKQDRRAALLFSKLVRKAVDRPDDVLEKPAINRTYHLFLRKTREHRDTFIAVSGEIDVNTVDAVLCMLTDRDGLCLLDLREVTFMDAPAAAQLGERLYAGSPSQAISGASEAVRAAFIQRGFEYLLRPRTLYIHN